MFASISNAFSADERCRRFFLAEAVPTGWYCPLLCSRRKVMLVLSRRLGEEIVIGGDIRLTIVAVKGERVRIGVTAPPAVTVDRQEVHASRAGRRGEWAGQETRSESPTRLDR